MVKVNKTTKKAVTTNIPPSKAHTLRALLIGSLADGETKIINPLLGEDQINLINCLKGLGVSIIKNNKEITMKGISGEYHPIFKELNCGESGVAMNFLMSASCLAKTPVTLTGKEGLLRRPVAEIVNGLRELGCNIEFLKRDGFPPVKINSHGINGGIAHMRGEKTSQYFSSIIISAPYSKEEITIYCIDDMSEKPYFDITIEMMKKFGVRIYNENYKTINIPSNQRYHATTIEIESDYSSASYFCVAAAITKTQVAMTGLNPYSCQGDKKIIELMREMGCEIKQENKKLTIIGENLKAIKSDFKDTPDLVPSMAIAAAFASGESILMNVGHLHYKECDRISVIQSELQKMGIYTKFESNNLIIRGDKKNIRGANINSFNDHRIAMSFAVAGLYTGEQTIDDEQCVKKSFPDFWEKLNQFY